MDSAVLARMSQPKAAASSYAAVKWVVWSTDNGCSVPVVERRQSFPSMGVPPYTP
jgi:hypothetical protein